MDMDLYQVYVHICITDMDAIERAGYRKKAANIRFPCQFH